MQLFAHPINWGNSRTLAVLARQGDMFYTDATTIANTIDVNGDAMGDPREFTHVWVKGKDIASYSATVAGSSAGSYNPNGTFTSMLPSTVPDSSGDDQSTVIGGFQHELTDVRDTSLAESARDPRDGITVNFTFTEKTGGDMEIHELMILNQLDQFDNIATEEHVGSNWRFQSDILGAVRQSIQGTLHKVPQLGDRKIRESLFLTVQSRRTNTRVVDLKQIFRNHRHFVCAVEYARFPDLVFPALVQPQLEMAYLNEYKGAGKAITFQITER